MIAGLVAITPSCGTVNTLGAIVVGLAAGVVCSYAVGLKFRWGYDDSLDVVGVHFVGGRRRRAVDRIPGRRGDDRRCRRACSTVADSPNWVSRRWRPWSSACYAFVVSYVLAKVIEGSSDSVSAPTTRRPASTSPSTPRPPTPRGCTGTSRRADPTRSGGLGALEQQRAETVEGTRTEDPVGLNGLARPAVDPSRVEVPASSGRRSCLDPATTRSPSANAFRM